MSSKNSGYSAALRQWCEQPHKLGHLLGFTKLEPVHDIWIKEFIRAGQGEVRILMAHRGSYKTTCGLVALLLLFMLRPDIRILISRKSDTMARKLVSAMEKIFRAHIVKAWMFAAYGVKTLETDKWSSGSLRLSINNRITPEPSLAAVGIGTVQTGDHYDYIWSDDIITPDDRYSKAVRESTKNYVFETENLIEPDGVRTFTGTVWHPDDAWTILLSLVSTKALIYPVGTVPIKEITPEWIEDKKSKMPASLWAANYELKHVKDVAREFPDPIPGAPPEDSKMVSYWFIDPAFGGKDCTAIWEGCSDGEYFYLTWAKMYKKSIAEKYDEIEGYFWGRQVSMVMYENNGAQRLVGAELERRNIPCKGVSSVTNKFARITSSLKPMWSKLRFHPAILASKDHLIESTEEAPPSPLVELLEFNIDADHDDSPDACAGLVTALHSAYGLNSEDALDVMRQFA